jgi:hypothetical protein
MIAPGSERATHYWLRNVSALDELMGVHFSQLSLDRVYTVSDWLMRHKDALEWHLRQSEGQLFSLKETIILYDLTNVIWDIVDYVELLFLRPIILETAEVETPN